MKAILRTACAALAALAMAGCAGNRGGGDGRQGEFVRVVVENDGTIPTQVRVYLVSDSGQETSLGAMTSLGTETLTARLPMVQGSYRLRAEGGTRYSLTSPRVSLRGNETITWDMRQNIVHLGTR